VIDLRRRLGDNGWLLSVVWLVFLFFPIISVWAEQDSLGRKLGATAALIAFAVVYVLGFHAMYRADEQECAGEMVNDRPDPRRYLAALVACLAIAYWLSGLGVLGAVPFLVSYSVFAFTWPTAFAIFACALVGPVIVAAVFDGEPVSGLLAAGLTACIGAAVMLIRLFDEHERAQAGLQTELAVTEERGRLSRDVHDVVGHNLTATIVKVELARALLEGVEADSPEGQVRLDRGRAELADLEAVSRRSLAEIRATVSGTRTADFDDELDGARAVLADAGVELTVVGDRIAIPETHRSTLAWVIREGVTNVVRHAAASNCRIELAPDDEVLLRLGDDGVGVGRPLLGDECEGNGLSGLRDRLAAAGLSLRVGPAAASTGTELVVTEEVDR
jgi:two-component system sensor histidine kinase DesK